MTMKRVGPPSSAKPKISGLSMSTAPSTRSPLRCARSGISRTSDIRQSVIEPTRSIAAPTATQMTVALVVSLNWKIQGAAMMTIAISGSSAACRLSGIGPRSIRRASLLAELRTWPLRSARRRAGRDAFRGLRAVPKRPRGRTDPVPSGYPEARIPNHRDQAALGSNAGREIRLCSGATPAGGAGSRSVAGVAVDEVEDLRADVRLGVEAADEGAHPAPGEPFDDLAELVRGGRLEVETG